LYNSTPSLLLGLMIYQTD